VRWIRRAPETLDQTLQPESFDLEATAAGLTAETGIAPVIARLLVVRGLVTAETAEEFLRPTLDRLHSPYKMLGMKAAVERLSAAIERKDRILIYGDYDVDGTTAVVILKTVIEVCGGQAEFHVPHRILEGYGMRDEVIERAAADGVQLIISVDTGIRAFAAAETAERLGLDLIVTDHHLPHEEGVPKALAVLNPNQAGCEYPCKSLCGAGVAFKVAQALLEKTGRERLVPSFLKIVAIATIADAVPLVGENRVFVKLGLRELSRPVNAGLKALLEVCDLNHGRGLTAGEVGFRIAPRMNAAGRMDVAKDVIELFTAKDPVRAREIAAHLNQLNGDRQLEEQRIVEAIHQQIAESPELRNAYCMVVDGEGWHRGVIGICASRVVDRYCRPALVIARDGGEAHGSGRSIPEFHLLQALESCPELFTRFGGHAHAVGFAMPTENLPELKKRLDAFARTKLTEKNFVPMLHYDGELGLDEVTQDLWDALCGLEPFGMGNPQPVFVARGARLLQSPKVMKEKHLKFKLEIPTLSLREKDGAPSSIAIGARSTLKAIDALAWRMAERLKENAVTVGDHLDVAFTIDRNTHPEYGGGLQLKVCDFALAAAVAAK
jgi:single-stranded-DNA-specific exonuclease